MALNGDALGALIKTKLAAVATPTNDAELTKFCNALGEAIVNYLILASTVTVDPSTFQGKLV